MKITIEPASVADIPQLAELNRQSYSSEIAARIAWANWPDEENVRAFFKARLRQRFDEGATAVFKAISSDLGEIVGFIACTLEERKEAETPETELTPTANIAQTLPPGMNAEFVMTAGSEVEKMRGLMLGERHYYISAFVVPPKYQRQGIGTQLLQYCLLQADHSELPTWLISFPGSHGLYLRHNFVDVKYVDIDLSKWDKVGYCGFGLYRNYAMRRQPQQKIDVSANV